jgi:hypothetical protein
VYTLNTCTDSGSSSVSSKRGATLRCAGNNSSSSIEPETLRDALDGNSSEGNSSASNSGTDDDDSEDDTAAIKRSREGSKEGLFMLQINAYQQNAMTSVTLQLSSGR